MMVALPCCNTCCVTRARAVNFHPVDSDDPKQVTKRHHGLLSQEIGFCHIRISDGVGSRLQLSGLLAKLCKLTLQARR